MKKSIASVLLLILPLLLLPATTFAATAAVMPAIFGIRLEFILFALTLAGVAIFHHKTMYVALIGLASILLVKYLFLSDFSLLEHITGSAEKEGEWRILLNLLGLLFGFAILAKYFEESGIPDWLPKVLPNDWKGGLVLLFAIMFISSFLDNIAAAMIGGAIAMVVFKGKVHIGYLAAIVAASNAGGAGSVVGDTTTTLMWIDGVNPLDVTHAFVASAVAFVIFGTIGSIQQDRYQRIQRDESKKYKIDWGRLFIVFLILVCAIITNWTLDFPAAGVWIAIIIGNFIRKAPWQEIPKSVQGTIFLMALVTCASLMPVDELPAASWQSAFTLGFVSAVFDNIPLTKLCLEQGGYDWGMLAYTVGFGGSMIWFGSSAGVALSNMYPEAKSVVKYVKNGWHVTVAYIIGFFVMLGTVGWHPHAPHKKHQQVQTEVVAEPAATPTGN
ncbi:MAG TPA: SLC13 family permease [Bacteroidales bacterium]|nr:SLC13 family permease [Bacteroidales bacterium]